VRVPLTSEQAEAIIDLLPERTPVAGYPIRALFTVIWDMSLRIGTMWRLEVPKHYKHGDDVLRISENIDKSRYARSLPLAPRARRTLDAICPDEGIIFRRFEYRRAGILDTKVDTEAGQPPDRIQPGTEMADRFRGVVRGGLGGEELAERTFVLIGRRDFRPWPSAPAASD